MFARVRVRMAPSPTGLFHVGSARTALFNWLFARRGRGKFLLRIEDTDRERCRPEFVSDIIEALHWLGLEWDEGPFFQSQRLHLYQEAARQLLKQGQAYHCCCTPEELAERKQPMLAAGKPPKYDGRCRSLSLQEREALRAEGRPAAVRFLTPQEGTTAFEDLIRGAVEFENALLDDFVILKSDGYPTYLLGCMVDDAEMEITHVIRGEDLLSSTPRQLLLYKALGKSPPQFAHLPLLLGPDRAKLSKRHGAMPVLWYRDQGFLPEAMVNFLALLGWSPGDDREILSREDLIEAFSLEGVGKSGAIFDIEKLKWMNGLYLRSLSMEKLAELARPFMERTGVRCGGEYLSRVLALEKERARTLGELPDLTGFFFSDDFAIEEKAAAKWFTRESLLLLGELAGRLEQVEPFGAAAAETALRSLAKEKEIRAASLIHPARVALSGRSVGPGLFEMMEVLGKARVLSRLRKAAALARGEEVW